MSYERALQVWLHRSVEPPPYTRVARAVEAAADPQTPGARRTAWARIALGVAAAGFVAMALIERLGDDMPSAGRSIAVLLPLSMAAVAGWWIPHRHLGRQMMVRAITWSNLVIGLLVAVWGHAEYALTGAPIAIGSGACLLILGGRGLGISSGPFRPMAFRTQLLLALVMACADASTLLFAGVVQLGLGNPYWDRSAALPTLVCGAVMVLAVWGIYRMRTWALLLNIAANLAIASAALHGWLGLTLPVSAALATTALVQLLLPVPILAAALGDRNPDRRPLGRFGPMFVRLVLIGFMLAGSLGWLMPKRLDDGAGYLYWRVGWVERHYRMSRRGLFPVS